MKRWLWYGAALALILAVSAESYHGADVGELEPVQTVRISAEDGLVVETDTGQRGSGVDLQAAFEDMERTAPSKLFLDTAEYLLIVPECEALLPELMDRLRPSCCVIVAEGEIDLAEVGQFLRAHPPKRTLMEYRAGLRELPVLKVEEGRMELG